jgi:hypothetical protein
MLVGADQGKEVRVEESSVRKLAVLSMDFGMQNSKSETGKFGVTY